MYTEIILTEYFPRNIELELCKFQNLRILYFKLKFLSKNFHIQTITFRIFFVLDKDNDWIKSFYRYLMMEKYVKSCNVIFQSLHNCIANIHVGKLHVRRLNEIKFYKFAECFDFFFSWYRLGIIRESLNFKLIKLRWYSIRWFSNKSWFVYKF